ncbi:Phosducin-like protein [Trichoplax sp. H2]|nr:Phosducin-like protein [Trichoplax sp. H2]|eukprot:RDD43152.1 Phosducin-like protein [Trichoplax sp. H2]
MATLEDRLLGEKLDYYCSSSEDEGHQAGKRESHGEEDEEGDHQDPSLDLDEIYSVKTDKTGPKGVIEDFRRYKQLEKEKRHDNDREKAELAKKLSMVCNTQQQEEDDIDFENDPILKQLMQRRLEEMKGAAAVLPKFGKLYEIKSTEYLDTIDKENSNVTVIVHLYNNNLRKCKNMTSCLNQLAKHYTTVKFCNARASGIPILSAEFTQRGLPALLLYRDGNVIGNFIRITDNLEDRFDAVDVENFLLEHAMLPTMDRTFADTLNSDSSDE